MKGVIYMRNRVTRSLLTERYHACGHDVIFTGSIHILETELANIHPDFILLHCHTLDEQEDFQRIRQLTATIHYSLPQCYIVVLYHPSAGEKYQTTHLHSYQSDLLLQEDFTHIWELAGIIRELAAGKKG